MLILTMNGRTEQVIDSCVLVRRETHEERQERVITRTHITTRHYHNSSSNISYSSLDRKAPSGRNGNFNDLSRTIPSDASEDIDKKYPCSPNSSHSRTIHHTIVKNLDPSSSPNHQNRSFVEREEMSPHGEGIMDYNAGSNHSHPAGVMGNPHRTSNGAPVFPAQGVSELSGAIAGGESGSPNPLYSSTSDPRNAGSGSHYQLDYPATPSNSMDPHGEAAFPYPRPAMHSNGVSNYGGNGLSHYAEYQGIGSIGHGDEVLEDAYPPHSLYKASHNLDYPSSPSPSPGAQSNSRSMNDHLLQYPYHQDYVRISSTNGAGYPGRNFEEMMDGSIQSGAPAPSNYEESGGYYPMRMSMGRPGVPSSNVVTAEEISHYGNLPGHNISIMGRKMSSNEALNSRDGRNVDQEYILEEEELSHLRIQSPASPSHHGYQGLPKHSPPPPVPPTSHPSSSTSQSTGVRWRDPDLHEVVQFLGNPNAVVKANAAAYLQHLCYMDDAVKKKTRALGGIAPLVSLLGHDTMEVHRNAAGALRNLSYGRQNDENKKGIKSAGGLPALVRLLKRTNETEIKELVTGVLWNMSSCEELKKSILDEAVPALVTSVILPYCEAQISTPSQPLLGHPPSPVVFKNASGVLRNVSSAGEYARKKLRESEGIVEGLLHVVRCALSRADIDDKCVENCVCILRNLSYRCQEVEDPNYDKHPPPSGSTRASANPTTKSDNLGCFGANKKKKEGAAASSSTSPKDSNNTLHTSGAGVNSTGRSSHQQAGGKDGTTAGMELLWQPDVVQAYLALLSNCSNPETLEAAAGAIQNLAACYWQPSIEIRAAVRKEKGLPVLVELLRMEVDRVVCAVATALRNLALDQRNKELIGKYAMRDLVQKLPSGRSQESAASDDTIAAVLATLNEVIKKNSEFSRSLMEAEGIERLIYLTQQRRRFSPRVVKFSTQVLYSMWQHQELREVYKKGGWTESDFIGKNRGGSPGGGPSSTASGDIPSAGSPVNANSTLNRPMASQSGTRYEDKTIHRNQTNNIPHASHPHYVQNDGVPLADMPYPEGASHAPPPASYRMYSHQSIKSGEPLYAQVNREKKKNRGLGMMESIPDPSHPYTSSPIGHSSMDNLAVINNPGASLHGDSWV